jgi:branched-chain amino acid transport system permease protein
LNILRIKILEGKGKLVFAVSILILLFLYPLLIIPSQRNLVAGYSIYFVWIILAESWNLTGGYTGLFNLGLAAFFGLGAIAAAVVLSLGLPFYLALLFSGVSGFLLASLLVPTFRLRSFYFAIATLILPLIVKPVIEILLGSSDFYVQSNSVLLSLSLYYYGLTLSTLTVLAVFFLLRTRIGIALKAIGDDETVSGALGINPFKYKTIAFLFSGFLGSLAGGFYLQIVGTVSTTIFENIEFSLFPIFMVIIGGSGTFEGPLFGAILFSVIDYYLTSLFPGTTINDFILSLSIIVIALLLPRGIVPYIKKLGIRLKS